MLKKYILFALLASGQMLAEATTIQEQKTQKTLTHGQKVVIYGSIFGGLCLLAKGMSLIIYPLLPTSLSPAAQKGIVVGICACTGFLFGPDEKQMDKIMNFFEKHQDSLLF